MKCLDAARVRRSISEEDLALRMIPKLGLDAPQFEVGAAAHRFAASTELAPAIGSADGTRATRLPRGASEAVKKRFALLTIVHPLDVGAEALKKWADRFGDYEILQPFPQLGREHAIVVATGVAPQRILRVDVRVRGDGKGEAAAPPPRRALSEIARDVGLA